MIGTFPPPKRIPRFSQIGIKMAPKLNLKTRVIIVTCICFMDTRFIGCKNVRTALIFSQFLSKTYLLLLIVYNVFRFEPVLEVHNNLAFEHV